MSEFKINKNTGYTVLSNNHFRNKNLSLKAKGLLSLMLSLPDDWDYSLAGLTTLSKDGIDSVRATLKELQKEGYLVIERTRDKKGKLSKSIYTVYETPYKPSDEDTHIGFSNMDNSFSTATLDFPMLENSILENPTQINTNLNNYLSKEDINDIYTNSKINFHFFNNLQDYGFKNVCLEILNVYQKILNTGTEQEKFHLLEFDNQNIMSIANKLRKNKSPIKYRQAYIKSILLNHTAQELNELKI